MSVPRRLAALSALCALTALGVVLAGCTPAQTGPDATGSNPNAPNPTEPNPTGPSSPALVSPAPDPTSPPAVSPTPTTIPSPSVDPGPALESATWGEAEGGRSLAVVPAPWVRTSQDPTAVDQVWAELIAAEPDADTPGMYDQLVCHAVGAPDKESWNLEPWRPDVGLLAVMQARCNPS